MQTFCVVILAICHFICQPIQQKCFYVSVAALKCSHEL